METDTNTDAFDLVKMGDSSLKNIEEMFLYAKKGIGEIWFFMCA